MNVNLTRYEIGLIMEHLLDGKLHRSYSYKEIDALQEIMNKLYDTSKQTVKNDEM